MGFFLPAWLRFRNSNTLFPVKKHRLSADQETIYLCVDPQYVYSRGASAYFPSSLRSGGQPSFTILFIRRAKPASAVRNFSFLSRQPRERPTTHEP